MKKPNHLKDSKFIEQLKSNNYVICPKDILFGFPQLSMQEKFAYLYLIQYGLFSIMNNHVDNNGNPIIYASQDRLANDMDISQSTVSRYMKKLEKAGLISIHSQGTGSHNYTTVYPTSYAPMHTEPMHPCIQYNRDIEKEEIKTDAPASDENESVGFSLKTSKKERERKASQTYENKNRKVDDIINDIVSKSPKVKPPKPKKERKVADGRNAQTLLTYYEEIFEEKFGSKAPLMTGKDLKLLKEMITHYGYDTVVGMVDFGVKHFESFKRDKGITGKPTVGVIFGFRVYLEEKARIFDEEPQQEVAPKVEVDDEESAW